MTRSHPEISDDVLEEGCYHLSRLGLSPSQIAQHFEISLEDVEIYAASYESKIDEGRVTVDDIDRSFWTDVRKDAEGDVKVTFVSRQGFHHAWRSELARLDGAALLSIFEASKDFLGSDPNSRFLDYPPPKGYDPLILDREIKRAVEIVSALMEEKWKGRGSHPVRSRKRDAHT